MRRRIYFVNLHFHKILNCKHGRNNNEKCSYHSYITNIGT